MIWPLYRLFAAPSMAFAFIILAPFNRKLRAVLGQKLQRRNAPTFPEAPVWIHAASGEFEYAKSVIREIKSRSPQTPVIVTYSSATYVKAIENFPGVDFSLPLPLDLPGPCASFLKKFKPRCLLIARTDLWPEILHQCQVRNIPITLFSYTQKSPERMNWLARKTRLWLLKLMTQVYCVTEDDAKNLRALGLTKNVSVQGDTRYDQVRYRLDHPKELPVNLKPARPALVAGSTWKEDEDILLEALEPALKEKKLQLLLVPHEPTEGHISELEKRLKKLGLKYKKFSQEQHWSDSEVLLVDRIGVLAEIYPWGDFAFVGGSFKGSVHSVMEPLGAGLLTLVGPHYGNNREAIEFARLPVGPFTAVQVCTDAMSFRRTVELLLGSNKEARTKQIMQAFQNRLGSSRNLSDQILGYTSARPEFSIDGPNS